MDIAIFIAMIILGVLAHFAKKKIKGETVADIRAYFETHFKTTITTVIFAFVAAMVLIQTAQIDAYSGFAAGYMIDSMFNKAPGIHLPVSQVN